MSTQPVKMTKELHLKLVEAWWDGELEMEGLTTNHWIKPSTCPNESERPSRYRIRPKPTLRPWNPEEVPVGAQYRYKASPEERSLILGVTAVELQLPMIVRNESITFQRALEAGEHSTDGGKTWKPCGVKEAA